MGDNLDAVVHAVDLTVVDEGAERFEHAHVADLEQFEQVGVCLSPAPPPPTEATLDTSAKAEAARVLPAFNGAAR